jgi:hypothetical protein
MKRLLPRLLLVALWISGCEQWVSLDPVEGYSAGDDDGSGSPADDDHEGDDTFEDDDDGTPEYTGEIEMDQAILTASCVATVQAVPDGPTPEGYFEFSINMEGWADFVWVELWDLTSDYCEGYDPDTGDPCETSGYVRPGWEMLNADFGWNPASGFWDYWVLYLEYIMDLAAADDAGKSIFICENAGVNIETWFCACDIATDSCFCTVFPMSAW